jgi:hypothetical protein
VVKTNSAIDRPASNFVDLDQGFPRGQEVLDSGPTADDEILEVAIAAVAAGDPDQARRRSSTLLNLNEIAIFGHDDGCRLASLLEDLRVLGAEKPEVRHMGGPVFSQVS